MKATMLIPFLVLASCEPSTCTEVLVEAPDYTPIGEALKFIGLSFLGCVLLACITSVINRNKK